VELGIYSFGDLGGDRSDAVVGQRLNALVRQARLADEAGLDVFALGEHHRPNFAVSAPEMVLAAIASVTRSIRLSTAVTVLSTIDPVRLMEQFGTLDLLSGGRAEIIAGRGSFTESFPLFGYRLQDYDALFDERIRLLLQLRDDPDRDWEGKFRTPLHDAYVGPRPLQERMPVWIGVGGTPESAVRAGLLGQPLFLALFTGPARAVSLVELYRQAAARAGHAAAGLRVASGGHMFVGRTSQGAREAFFPYYSKYFSFHPSFPNGMPRGVYDQWIASGLLVGSPQQVIDGIMTHRELLGTSRYVGQFDVGMPEAIADESLELFLAEVLPVVHAEGGNGQGQEVITPA
jgi:alkanesulfonate monooxygenase SsuD/methylene tetrahydromethanopterin reductase-like flavin-dependent oxidoreductase (luciferase family)